MANRGNVNMPFTSFNVLATLIAVATAAPVGSILTTLSDVCPPGTVIAHGQIIDASAAPELISVYGSRFGGDGINSFRVPELRGQILRGFDSTGQFDLGADDRKQADGTSSNTIGSTQEQGVAMPRAGFQVESGGTHSHSMSNAGNHSHFIAEGGSGFNRSPSSSNFLRVTAYVGHGLHNENFEYQLRAAASSSGEPKLFKTSTEDSHQHLVNNAGSHDHLITGGDKETVPANVAVNFCIWTTDLSAELTGSTSAGSNGNTTAMIMAGIAIFLAFGALALSIWRVRQEAYPISPKVATVPPQPARGFENPVYNS